MWHKRKKIYVHKILAGKPIGDLRVRWKITRDKHPKILRHSKVI